MKVINTFIVFCNRLGTIPAPLYQTEDGKWYWTHFDCGNLHTEEIDSDVAQELITEAKNGKGRKPIKP